MPSEANRPRPQEQEAIRTTIVGGRPPGCGKAVGGVPRGIEVLVKKAAVDPEFRSLLLAERGQAARSIGLELSAAESMMLSAVPAAQLRSIIGATTVPQAYMPAFLGKVAAVMLAALGVVQAGCDDNKGQPAGIRPEDMPKDNPATASRPAEPTDVQTLTIAGAVIVKPLTRPATPSTQPAAPVVAGVMIDRPEATTILGIGPDTSLVTLPAFEDDGPYDMAGFSASKPPARPAIPPIDLTLQPAEAHADNPAPIAGEPVDRPFGFSDPAWKSRSIYGSRPLRPEDSKVPRLTVDLQPSPPTPADDLGRSIGGLMAVKPPTRPEVTLQIGGTRADNPAPIAHGMAGVMAGKPPTRPVAPEITIRFPGAREDNPAPIAVERIDRPPDPVEVAGLRAIRPEDVRIAGLTADATTRPATQPATEPATNQPSPNITRFGLMIDRPQNTAIRGLRADIPPVAPATQPATQPTTQPAADSTPPASITVFGVIADRPMAIRGIRVDRPNTPATAPTTNPTTRPAAQSAQPEPPMIIAGIMPTPPNPAPEPPSRGIRPDRPPAPTTKPAAQTDPVPDFPIAIDGIRPDRPKPNAP